MPHREEREEEVEAGTLREGLRGTGAGMEPEIQAFPRAGASAKPAGTAPSLHCGHAKWEREREEGERQTDRQSSCPEAPLLLSCFNSLQGTWQVW